MVLSTIATLRVHKSIYFCLYPLFYFIQAFSVKLQQHELLFVISFRLLVHVQVSVTETQELFSETVEDG